MQIAPQYGVFFKYKFYVHDIIFSKTNKSAVTNFHISYVLWVFLD